MSLLWQCLVLCVLAAGAEPDGGGVVAGEAAAAGVDVDGDGDGGLLVTEGGGQGDGPGAAPTVDLLRADHLAGPDVVQHLDEEDVEDGGGGVIQDEVSLEERHKLFNEWMHASGLEASVALSVFPSTDTAPEHRGMRATRAIAKGEVIVRVPGGHIFTGMQARRLTGDGTAGSVTKEMELRRDGSKAGEILRGLRYALPQNAYLAIMLLHEMQRPESFWRTWLDILPQETVKNITLSYDEQSTSGNEEEEVRAFEVDEVVGVR